MTLSHLYDGAALTHDIAPSTVRVTSAAENGEAAMSGLTIEDPDADLVLRGHRPFVIEEDACTQPRLFTGWTTERGIGRDVESGLHGDATKRAHDVTLIDLNALWSFRLITGEDGNRPGETGPERLAWLLGSDYLAGLIEDTGFCDIATSNLDPADYRGNYASAVMGDIADGPAGEALNWFAFWDVTAAAVGLWMGALDDEISDSTLRISNVFADIDGTTTFAPDPGARLIVSPTETYSEVELTYAVGTKKLFRSRESTATKYIRRGTAISNGRIGKLTTAQATVEKFLDRHANEQDRLTATIIVPASAAGLVVAGQRMDVKFSHLSSPYTAFTSMRVVRCTVQPTNDLATHYGLELELLAPRPASSNSAGTSYFSHADDLPITCAPAYNLDWGGQRFLYTLPAGVTGDGFSGPVDGFRIICTPGPARDVTVTVTFDSSGAWFEDDSAVYISKVDDRVWQYFNADAEYDFLLDAGTIDATTTTLSAVLAIPESDVDIFRHVCLRARGSGSTVLTAVVVEDGTNAPDTETPLPPPPGATVTDTADPAAADSGYQPGQLWVNTATGETFVLSDNTPGAAVWTSVTAHGALDDLTDVDTTGVAGGDALVFDSGTSTWGPGSAGGGTPSDTVSDETAWDIAPDAGASTDYARGDHTHGTPTEPTGGVSEITDIPTAETDTALVLAPDGAGGVEFRAEAGGGAVTIDTPPASPDARNEEFGSATLVNTWTWQASGGTPTNQSIGRWTDTAPSDPSWNADTDKPGELVMMPNAGLLLAAYMDFVPTAGTRWVVGVKMAAGNIEAVGNLDDRVGIWLTKESPSASSDEATDGVGVQINTYGSMGVRWYAMNGGGASPGATWLLNTPIAAYVAIAGFTDDSIRVYASLDGRTWVRGAALSGKNINANVKYLKIAVRDTTNSGTAIVGSFGWLRFLAGENDPTKLGFGS